MEVLQNHEKHNVNDVIDNRRIERDVSHTKLTKNSVKDVTNLSDNLVTSGVLKT